MDRLARVKAFVREQPWAILPGTLAVIQDVIRFRAAGGRLSDEDIQARIGDRADRSGGRMQGSVAVLPLHGIIAHRARMVDDLSGPGGTSTESFAQGLRAALADPDVKSVLIDVDSPGGSAFGVQELADEIRASRGRKPIVAVANSMAASAAYWLATAADELVVTPSGLVGSLGVFSAHEDVSKQLEQEGVKVTLISAGEYKTEGNPFEPLTDEARAEAKRMVDTYYKAFVGGVAKGRGVAMGAVEADFGQGRSVLAKEAVKRGMADRVGTFDAELARMVAEKESPRGDVRLAGPQEPAMLLGRPILYSLQEGEPVHEIRFAHPGQTPEGQRDLERRERDMAIRERS